MYAEGLGKAQNACLKRLVWKSPEDGPECLPAAQLLVKCLQTLIGSFLGSLNGQLRPALVLPGWRSSNEPANVMLQD